MTNHFFNITNLWGKIVFSSLKCLIIFTAFYAYMNVSYLLSFLQIWYTEQQHPTEARYALLHFYKDKEYVSRDQ